MNMNQNRPYGVEAAVINDIYCKFVTKTKIFLPFLGAITLVVEK